MGCALNIKNTTMERMKEEEEEGERGISRQTRIVSSFFLSFKDKRKKQSGNKRSAKKCFPESLRNFKVWFALTLSCSGSEMCWRRWQRGDGSRSSLWTPPTPPQKKQRIMGCCLNRPVVSEIPNWEFESSYNQKRVQVWQLTRCQKTHRTVSGAGEEIPSSLCTMCHQVVKSRNCTRDHRRQERVKTPDHYNWWATFSSYVDEW